MATWEQLREYIKGNYAIDEEDRDWLTLTLHFDAGRSQQVRVAHMTFQDVEWAVLSTMVCREDDLQPMSALRRNGELVFGGLALIGESFIFRHAVELAHVDPAEFEAPLRVTTEYGDLLEKEITGQDVY